LTRREALELIGLAAASLPASVLAQSSPWPQGAIIRTVLKDYQPEELQGGATLFHEHVSLGPNFNDQFRAAAAAARAANGTPPNPNGEFGDPPPRPAGTPPPVPPPDPQRDVNLMTAELMEAKRQGVACMVDAGHADMGRDLAFVREASSKSGMPIVAGVGFYAEPWYPQNMAAMSEDEIVADLIRQVDETPAGAFGEIGSWDEITAVERKVFRAIGKAHVATNLPILTHTGIPGKSALEQLNILEDMGVKPDRVAIGHLGSAVDPDVYLHKQVARRGAFIGFDRQGGNGDARQVPMVMALIDAGFADRLLFSSDASRGYGKTLTAFVPKLKAAGATDEVLHRILVDNPRRFLAFVPKRPRQA
jgi:phosphotriesterase-related protein